MYQLTLPIQLQDNANFDNYLVGANQPLIDYLKGFIRGQHDSYLYLWGNTGAGCSHLLQACYQTVLEQGATAVYLPLQYISEFQSTIFEGLENVSLVCLDDIHTIAGQAPWEEAVFHFYNRIQSTPNKLMIGGRCVPKELNIQLPDLTSRLMSGMILAIQSLTDEEKIAALQLRAKLRGFDLPVEVAQFLLYRFPRNLTALFNTLEQLDRESLVLQRKLTVPFVKKVLNI